MTPRSDNLNSSKFSQALQQSILAQFQGDWVSRLNVEHLFVLIDGVLPFEACLYYQVLPLFLEGNRLHLGMVSPEDTAASEYVRRIISYLNYSLVSHSISSEGLRVVLTAYLNHTGNQQPGSTRYDAFSYGHYRHTSRHQTDRQINPSERLTLVVDSPDDLYHPDVEMAEVVISPLDPPPPVEIAADRVTDLEKEAETEIEVESQTLLLVESDSLETSVPVEAVPVEPSLEPEEPLLVAANGASSPAESALVTEVPSSLIPDQKLAILKLATHYLEEPVEVLATLPARELLQELLARVLMGGIGRLYFECHPHHGRVVWSQNGVLQSVLDQLDQSTFHSVIQELKIMACISLMPIDQPQQADIEYLYERNRVLLRFRFMAGMYGEEVTVQVLRGAALKFYQQQQINKLEKDAVSIAKQLQNKLHEIRSRAYSDPALLEARLEMLPKLTEILHTVEQELDALGGDRAN